MYEYFCILYFTYNYLYMAKKIYLFGTFGDLNGLPMGGGHMSARRIWHELEKIGYKVEIHNRIRFYGPRTLLNKTKSAIGMILDAVIWLFRLVFGNRNKSLAIVIGYGGVMAPLDFAIISIASFLGFKTIYYLKGGGTDKMYENGSIRNRRYFKNTLLKSSLVLTEGEENVNFVKHVSQNRVKACYMPNFIENGFFPMEYPQKPNDQVNILYFGRIDESKNVKLIVEIFNIVAEKYPETTLTIVGKQGTKYANEVDEMIGKSNFKNRITRIGHSSHEDLAKIMREQHIFLFPSVEDREGHSNSLNEAMAWGLVPVVSDHNFLPSIVGEKDLIVSGFKAKDYADIIARLINEQMIISKSHEMYQRVKDNFIQDIVEKKMYITVESVFSN